MKKPVIGSNVGVNDTIINGNGMIAGSTIEWVNAFETLLYDRAFYEKCKSNICNSFFKTYHFSVVSKQILEILNGQD